MNAVRILFVCLGNICRSPLSQGIFRVLVEQAGMADKVSVDSAGTHGHFTGHAPDPRAQAVARAQGIDISSHRARAIQREDFYACDYIIAMDRENYCQLRQMSPPEQAHKIRLLLDFAPDVGETEVPDPYYGTADGFEKVCHLLARGGEGLLAHLCF